MLLLILSTDELCAVSTAVSSQLVVCTLQVTEHLLKQGAVVSQWVSYTCEKKPNFWSKLKCNKAQAPKGSYISKVVGSYSATFFAEGVSSLHLQS